MSEPTRRVIVTVLMHADDEGNTPAVPALRAAIEKIVLNPGEVIESITESAREAA